MNEKREIAHSKIVVYSLSALNDTNLDIPRVLSGIYAHPMEERDVQKHSEHGLFAHHQPSALAVCFANVQLDRACSSLSPLILFA